MGKTNAIIVHGIGGSASGNWFPWLKRELESRGCETVVPQFPPIEKHTLTNWREAFKQYEPLINSDTLLVGHSLGATFLLNVLQDRKTPVKACFFVSGFCSRLGNDEFDVPNRSFLKNGFDWKKIRENGNKFTVIHSDTDPYVPMRNARELADNVGTDVFMIRDSGHFMAENGYLTFPLLLERIAASL